MWDHNQTHGVPGYFFTADEQCRFFFKGLEGSGAAEQDSSICQTLKCSDGKAVVETGPPLEGTSCGGAGTAWCRAGLCVPVQGASWGRWRPGSCRSACVKHSMGVRSFARTEKHSVKSYMSNLSSMSNFFKVTDSPFGGVIPSRVLRVAMEKR